MASFEVHGPFAVDWEQRKGGRTLLFEKFWSPESEASYLATRKGCYVFAIRNRGLTPIYVGKATKTYSQETFNPWNREKYSNGFSEYAKGTPVMYFVVLPKSRGPANAKQIAQVEDFLIQAGVAKNPGLQNVRGIQKPDWSIKGVIRHGAGHRSASELQFVALFDIRR
jgi:hypothetical protein